MAKYKDLRAELLNILRDGQKHTIDDIEQKCKEKGIDLPNKRDPIYNIVHQLKKKGIIRSEEKGTYRINDMIKQEEGSRMNQTNIEIETYIKGIKKEIRKYKDFSWVNCSEEEWRRAKSLGKQMMELSEEINDIFF